MSDSAASYVICWEFIVRWKKTQRIAYRRDLTLQDNCGKIIVRGLLSVDSYYTMVQYNSYFWLLSMREISAKRYCK